MKFRSILLTLPLIWAIAACESNTKAADEFSIEGHVKGMDSKVLHFERITPARAEQIQDVQLDAEGNFSFHGKAEPNGIFQLRADDGRRMLLFPENDALVIDADIDEMEAFQVTGGAKAKQLRDFNLKQYRLYIDYASAEARLDGLDRQKDTLAWHELEGVTDKAQVAYNGFLRSYCDTVSLPIMRAHAALSVAPTGNYHYLRNLSRRIAQETPGSGYAATIDAALLREAESRVGVIAPPLTGTDLTGKAFDLLNLRGRRIFIFFWASYCEFSRMELAHIKSMQGLFAEHNVAFVCFSIDDHDAEWRSFLQTAGLDWATHLRGLNGQQSNEIKQYKLKAIPSTYWINGDGVIESLDIRSQDLKSVLSTTPTANSGE